MVSVQATPQSDGPEKARPSCSSNRPAEQGPAKHAPAEDPEPAYPPVDPRQVHPTARSELLAGPCVNPNLLHLRATVPHKSHFESLSNPWRAAPRNATGWRKPRACMPGKIRMARSAFLAATGPSLQRSRSRLPLPSYRTQPGICPFPPLCGNFVKPPSALSKVTASDTKPLPRQTSCGNLARNPFQLGILRIESKKRKKPAARGLFPLPQTPMETTSLNSNRPLPPRNPCLRTPFSRLSATTFVTHTCTLRDSQLPRFHTLAHSVSFLFRLPGSVSSVLAASRTTAIL